MTVHNISFLYTGRMADAGAMDAGYFDKAMAGGRIVLASHCHFATTGRIPVRMTIKTRDFRVVAATPRYGSIEILFLVVFTGGLALKVALKFLEGLASGIGEGMGRDIYKIVLRRSVRDGLKRYAERKNLRFEEPSEALRIEPHLPWPDDLTGESSEDDFGGKFQYSAPMKNTGIEYQKLRRNFSRCRRGRPCGRHRRAERNNHRGLQVCRRRPTLGVAAVPIRLAALTL